jgi:predicted flavoprotein YhiN
LELSDALQEIGELGVRGQAGMLLLNSHAVRLEREIGQLRLERNTAQEKYEAAQVNYQSERRTSAVLQTQLTATLGTNRFRQALVTVGGIVLGVGLSGFLASLQPGWTIPSTILGILLLLLGWFLPTPSDRGDS